MQHRKCPQTQFVQITLQILHVHATLYYITWHKMKYLVDVTDNTNAVCFSRHCPQKPSTRTQLIQHIFTSYIRGKALISNNNDTFGVKCALSMFKGIQSSLQCNSISQLHTSYPTVHYILFQGRIHMIMIIKVQLYINYIIN